MRTHQPCSTCNSSDGLTEYEKNTYCFSCGEFKYKGKTPTEFEHYFPIWEDTHTEEGLQLPYTTNSKFNHRAESWLMKNGLTPALRSLYRIGFVANETVPVPKSKWTVKLQNRIIFPCYGVNGLLYYQARATDPDDKVKYYTIGEKAPFWAHRHEDKKSIVITEDIVSTIRAGIITNAVALCGTKFSKELLLQLTENYDRIIVWMDSDRAGVRAARELTKRLRLLTDNVVKVRSRKEAKQCHTSELNRILSQYMASDISQL